MRQAIHEQYERTRMLLADLDKGYGDEEHLRTLAKAFGHSLLATIETINEIEREPARRTYDAIHGGRPFSGVAHSAIHSAITKLCYRLRPLQQALPAKLGAQQRLENAGRPIDGAIE